MRKLLYVLFLASVISSCGSHKSTMKQEIYAERIDSTHNNLALGYTSAHGITDLLKSSESRKIKWKVYDTGRPKDPDTGKHPLLAEGSMDEVADTERNTGIQHHDSMELDINTSSWSAQKTDSKKEELRQSDGTTLFKQISGGIWALAVLALLVIVCIIIYKRLPLRP